MGLRVIIANKNEKIQRGILETEILFYFAGSYTKGGEGAWMSRNYFANDFTILSVDSRCFSILAVRSTALVLKSSYNKVARATRSSSDPMVE